MLAHPDLPSCADCQKWWYVADGWKITERPRGNPLLRPPNTPTPCAKCPKSRPDARPHPEKELSGRTWAAYFHYLECKAVGRFPDDPLVRRHAALIHVAEQNAERGRDTATAQLLTMIALKPPGK